MAMKSGTNTGSIEMSAERRRRQERRRKSQERAWAAKSGPVTVRRVPPEQLRQSAP